MFYFCCTPHNINKKTQFIFITKEYNKGCHKGATREYKKLRLLTVYLWSYVTFNCQGDIPMGSLKVEEPVHTSWSRFCTINHQPSASNYQLSNRKHPVQDSNRRPQRLEASTLTTTPPSPLETL